MLNTPFRQAVAVMGFAFLLIKVGIPFIPPLIGFASAPVPNTVFIEYMIPGPRTMRTALRSLIALDIRSPVGLRW